MQNRGVLFVLVFIIVVVIIIVFKIPTFIDAINK